MWTPEQLQSYGYYRVRAGAALPFVCLRLDGWQVGERWCLSAEEACQILNERGAEPMTGDRFKRGTAPIRPNSDGWDMAGDREPEVAQRDWHTHARVRVRQQVGAGSVDPPGGRIFRAGEVYEMFQWGLKGRPAWRNTWWDSFDIDGAHIIDADAVEVIEILDEVSPE